MAVVGWGVLVGYMMAAGAGSAMAHDDAQHGASSIGVLVGAELNTMLALIAATAILAVAIARNHGRLTFAVSASDTNAELRRYDGVVMQFMGDGVLAAFNAPRPNRDHAANALRAAVDIQTLQERSTLENQFRLHARIGINTGAVVHGMLGTPDRLGYTVIGDEVQHRRTTRGAQQAIRHDHHGDGPDPPRRRRGPVRFQARG